MSLIEIKDDLNVSVTNDTELAAVQELLQEILDLPTQTENALAQSTQMELVDHIQMLIGLYKGTLNALTFNQDL